MAKTIETEIEIHASAERVWHVLTDLESYPEWNPFVTHIGGELAAGETLSVQVQPPGSNAMRFNPTLLVYKPNQELRWQGKFLIPGLFDGEHYFRVVKTSDNAAIFKHGEHFSGMLVPFFGGGLKKTKRGFELMNEALKARAES